jgi:sulfur carrier protein ThiS
VFAANSAVRGYILDDQDCLRKHVTVFINGQPVKDRQNLSDTVAADGEVFVMQALSGG